MFKLLQHVYYTYDIYTKIEIYKDFKHYFRIQVSDSRSLD